MSARYDGAVYGADACRLNEHNLKLNALADWYRFLNNIAACLGNGTQGKPVVTVDR